MADAARDSCFELAGPSDKTRRGFVIAAVYSMWGMITAALAAPAAVYLLGTKPSKSDGDWVEAGNMSELPPNQPVELVFLRQRTDGWKVQTEKKTAWVIRSGDNQVVAFGPQCTHLGCAYHFDDNAGKFVCPCHTSLFSIDGKVLTGPAPRPLDRYEAKVKGNKLLLGRLLISEEKSV